MKEKIFGFSGFTSNQLYENFDWKNFTSDSLVVRVVKPSSFETWYREVYLHKILNKYYVHEDDCKICDILFSDHKYNKIQDELLNLSISDKKEKWLHIIQNSKVVEFFGFIESSPKLNRFRFYDQLSNQILSIIYAKNITDSIADLNTGSSIKLIFKTLPKFPYHSLEDIIIGQPKQLFSDENKRNKLIDILNNNAFKEETMLSHDDAQVIIDEWYLEATKLLNKYRAPAVKEATIQNVDDLGWFTDDNKSGEDNNSDDEILF